MQQDDKARRRATLAGGAFLAALLLLGLWVAQAMSERQALERCIEARRRDCGGLGEQIPLAPARGYAPVR